MSVQNPNIPSPTDAKGIDSVIVDLQTHLSFELSWLTNGMGRAYRMKKVRSGNQTIQFLPLVYLGTSTYDYFDASPDNDKEGQSIILVGDASYPNFQRGFYGIKTYPVSLIFSANLETINSTLLLTEDFTEHLIIDVDEALTRDMLGKAYQLTIDNVTRVFDDVYAEFDINSDLGKTNKPLAPMTYFRFDLTVQIREGCPITPLDRCTAITNNLTAEDLCSCIIPSLDFTIGNDIDYDCLSVQQLADLQERLCPDCFSFLFDGANEVINCGTNAAFDVDFNNAFSFAAWIKPNSLALLNFILTKFDVIGSQGWEFTLLNGKIRLLLSTGTGAGSDKKIVVDGTTVLNTAQWYHVVATYDGSNSNSGVSIYLDSVAESTTNGGGPLVGTLITAKNLQIGGQDFFFFDGNIASARMWNVELTAGEITTEYNGGAVNFSPVQSANLIVDPDINNSTFGAQWVVPDLTGITGGYASINMEAGDKVEDCP